MSYQNDVLNWLMAAFSQDICRDPTERCHRFLEESLELVQSAGLSAVDAHALVDYVYGRPSGEIYQEVGCTMVTLAALCNVLSIDMVSAGEIELARCWQNIDKIRAKQAAKPKHIAKKESV